MSSPSSSLDAEADARKRVCKACDRCRIKKSKCDGKKPCSRCRNDDAICVFGGRKKKADRVHPKGYVEILERQQRQLVKGIRALYDRQLNGSSWDGPVPQNGYPPTHEILEFLGALDVEDSSDDEEHDDRSNFEDSVQRLRHLICEKNGALSLETKKSGVPQSSDRRYIPQERSPRRKQGQVRLDTTSRSLSPPALSPDTFNARHESPSTSISTTSVHSQRQCPSMWLEQKTFPWLEGALSIEGELVTSGLEQMDDSPMQGVFEDPFLVPPWDADPDDTLTTLMAQ